MIKIIFILLIIFAFTTFSYTQKVSSIAKEFTCCVKKIILIVLLQLGMGPNTILAQIPKSQPSIYENWYKNEIVTFKEGFSMDYLEGITSISIPGKGEKKIKDLTPDIFDYVFYTDKIDGQFYLYPLSSGKFEGKQAPYNYITFKTKKNVKDGAKQYWEFVDGIIKVISLEDRDSTGNTGADFFKRYIGDAYIINSEKDRFKKRQGWTLLRAPHGVRDNNRLFYEAAEKNGIYYRFFNSSQSYTDLCFGKIPKPEGNDAELFKQDKGYEILYSHELGVFGVADITDGKKYWGNDAVKYLDDNYLNADIREKMATEAYLKKEAEKERIAPYGFAFFSEKGAGCVKEMFKIKVTTADITATVIFSGRNKNDNIIDAVYLIPPTGGEIEKNPIIEPTRIFSFEKDDLYRIIKYFVVVDEGDHYVDLFIEKKYVDMIYNVLNDPKWVNKTGIKNSFIKHNTIISVEMP